MRPNRCLGSLAPKKPISCCEYGRPINYSYYNNKGLPRERGDVITSLTASHGRPSSTAKGGWFLLASLFDADNLVIMIRGIFDIMFRVKN